MSVQISSKEAFAYAELLEILNHMEKAQVEKLPKKLITVFETCASKEYTNHLDLNIPLENQISEETAALLAMLLLNYWYESEEQKQELINLYTENERKYQESLREKYNPENIFTNNNISEEQTKVNLSFSENSVQKTQEPSNSYLPIDYNSLSWHKKLFTKIKSFIYKLFQKKSSSL